jgi:hypothetical protein
MLTQAAVAPGQVPQLTLAPSLFDQVEVDFVGLQIWQVFAPVPPLVMKPPIQHPAWQLPPLQTLPLPMPPQFVPLPSGVH